MNKEEKKILNIGVVCRPRNSQNTYNNFIQMYRRAEFEKRSEIKVTFLDPELDRLQEENRRLKEQLKELKVLLENK